MDAKEGQSGLYAWRSIMKGREVIWRGAKWRVGNGESIKLWGDNWLPSLTCPRIQGPLQAKLQDETVSSLLDPTTRLWNLTLLPIVFTLEKA